MNNGGQSKFGGDGGYGVGNGSISAQDGFSPGGGGGGLRGGPTSGAGGSGAIILTWW
jgi:hypothetical protein